MPSLVGVYCALEEDQMTERLYEPVWRHTIVSTVLPWSYVIYNPPIPDRKQADKMEEEIEVTPAMIEAGLEFLLGEHPYCARPASREEITETLKLVYPAMHAARRVKPVVTPAKRTIFVAPTAATWRE